MIAILGAGLSGLSAGWHLRRKGIKSVIFEKEKCPGGLCRTKKISGYEFDYDGHLLHFKYHETHRLINDQLGIPLSMHERNAWIYAHGVFSKYPFQANLYRLPPAVAQECLLGFIKASKNARLRGQSADNFRDWIYRTFGSGIARHFMVPYNRKFWTVPAQSMTCEWLDMFIPVPSLPQVIEGTLQDSTRKFGYNAIFWYPRAGGIGQLADAFGKGQELISGDGVSRIDTARRTITLSSGQAFPYGRLISTIPLPEMSRLLTPVPQKIKRYFNALRWTSVLNINLGFDTKDRHDRHWIYFPQKDISFFRVGFPHNFASSSVPKGKSSVYIEVSYKPRARVDRRELIAAALRDFSKVLMNGRMPPVRVRDVNDIHYGYAIYDARYQAARNAIEEYLRSMDIIACGRYGSWRYFSMEDSIRDGRRAAELAAANL